MGGKEIGGERGHFVGYELMPVIIAIGCLCVHADLRRNCTIDVSVSKEPQLKFYMKATQLHGGKRKTYYSYQGNPVKVKMKMFQNFNIALNKHDE